MFILLKFIIQDVYYSTSVTTSLVHYVGTSSSGWRLSSKSPTNRAAPKINK